MDIFSAKWSVSHSDPLATTNFCHIVDEKGTVICDCAVSGPGVPEVARALRDLRRSSLCMDVATKGGSLNDLILALTRDVLKALENLHEAH